MAYDWRALSEMDPWLEAMRSAGTLPKDDSPEERERARQQYIGAKYGEPGNPDHFGEWTREHEEDLPEPFQT